MVHDLFHLPSTREFLVHNQFALTSTQGIYGSQSIDLPNTREFFVHEPFDPPTTQGIYSSRFI